MVNHGAAAAYLYLRGIKQPEVKKPLPQEWLKLLGTIPDKDIARLYGLKKGTVAWHRRSRGIEAFKPEVKDPKRAERKRKQRAREKAERDKKYGGL